MREAAMFKCKYKVGLLNLSDCNRPTDEACVHCNRTVCAEHREEREEGPVCLECLAEKYPDDQLGERGMQTRWRNRVFDRYGYHSRFYGAGRGGRGEGYRERDYETFDEDQEPKDDDALIDEDIADEGDDTAADFQDS